MLAGVLHAPFGFGHNSLLPHAGFGRVGQLPRLSPSVKTNLAAGVQGARALQACRNVLNGAAKEFNREGPMTAIVSRKAGALQGEARVPGDKSISHRALMIGANAVGETRVHGLLEGDDVMATAESLRALGAEITKLSDGQGNVTWQGYCHSVFFLF